MIYVLLCYKCFSHKTSLTKLVKYIYKKTERRKKERDGENGKEKIRKVMCKYHVTLLCLV